MASGTVGSQAERGDRRNFRGRLQLVPLALIRMYQLAIAPLLGPHCRFEPSCSRYASEAIERYGVLRGCWLAARRILRCHPFSAGGIDPVG